MNLVVDERPGSAAVWHISAFEYATKVLMRLAKPNEQQVVGFLVFDPQLGQGGGWVLFPLPLACFVWLTIMGLHHFFSCAFGSALL